MNSELLHIESPKPVYRRRPEWLKTRLTGSEASKRIAELLQVQNLNTVCRSARCPNVGECWGRGTATFMILGETCTRRCRFCAVIKGQTKPVDEAEPRRLAEAARAMGLHWVVITSVTRDDLPDGGAGHFARTIRAVRELLPDAGIEILVPDFNGKSEAIDIIFQALPDVLNHNIETVPRLYQQVRPGADYDRSLQLLERFAERGLKTKSGLMVGLGETLDEVHQVLRDLRARGCRMLTVGQYLAPSREHLPVERFVTPQEFKELEAFGYEMGFDYVSAGPLVRSSYRAEEGVLHRKEV